MFAWMPPTDRPNLTPLTLLNPIHLQLSGTKTSDQTPLTFRTALLMSFSIRPARADDAETLATLILELARFEQLESEARATPEALREHLFGPRPYAEALIAEVDAQPVGFALFFHNFSTFRGQPGLYLEDIFVRESHRGRGIGKAMLTKLAKLALERGCGRLEWVVLNWNDAAIDFYRYLGGRPMSDWTTYRVDEEALERLARMGVISA